MRPVPRKPDFPEVEMGLFTKLFGSYSDRELKRIMPIAKAVEDREEAYAALTDEHGSLTAE